jgi:hypothetical protein
MCPGSSNDASWINYLAKAGMHLTDLTRIQTAKSTTGDEVLHYHIIGGVLIGYEYDGKIGGTWSIQGAVITLKGPTDGTQFKQIRGQ